MQFDLKAIKQKFAAETYQQVKDRRQAVLRILKDLSVLDYAGGELEGGRPRESRKNQFQRRQLLPEGHSLDESYPTFSDDDGDD